MASAQLVCILKPFEAGAAAWLHGSFPCVQHGLKGADYRGVCGKEPACVIK